MERRLGRGLGSLLGGSDPLERQEQVRELPLDAIRPNPHQPRRTFDPVALEELRDSIRRHGILQPIVVRPAGRDQEGRSFEIVSGERRWRASQMAGVHSIPVTVREVDSDQMLELALVENLQRQDLDAIERATGYQQMMKSLNVTQEQVAEKVGLKRSTVANHLRLLELPPAAQDAVRRNLISMGHARALLGLTDPARVLGLVERIGREELSVREVERLVREAGRVTSQGKVVMQPQAAPAPWVRELETRLREQLGTAVQVRNAPGYRGQIVIEYFDRKDLDRLCQRLAPRDEIR